MGSNMKIKTAELAGVALDWEVARCEGLLDKWGVCAPVGFRPSSNWLQGGPIIEREIVELVLCQSGSNGPIYWEACAGLENEPGHAISVGPTPLVAAMRCYVVSKLGNEVDVPEGLIV